MIDQLIKLVQQNAGDDIVHNPAIPDQYNDEAVKEVGREINEGLEREARSGDIQNMMSMFKGNTSGGLTNNPMVRSIISNATGKLAAKFGLPPEKANQIAASLIPKVLNQFINKTNDPNDREFDLQDVLKNLTGNSNIGDIMGQFTSGGNKAGGLGETLGGLFGKNK